MPGTVLGEGLQLWVFILFISWTPNKFCIHVLVILLGVIRSNVKRNKYTAMEWRHGVWDLSEKNKQASIFLTNNTAFKKLSINNRNSWTSKIRLWLKVCICTFPYSLKLWRLFMLKYASRIINCTMFVPFHCISILSLRRIKWHNTKG